MNEYMNSMNVFLIHELRTLSTSLKNYGTLEWPIGKQLKCILMEKVIRALPSNLSTRLTPKQVDQLIFVLFDVRPNLKLMDVNLLGVKVKRILKYLKKARKHVVEANGDGLLGISSDFSNIHEVAVRKGWDDIEMWPEIPLKIPKGTPGQLAIQDGEPPATQGAPNGDLLGAVTLDYDWACDRAKLVKSDGSWAFCGTVGEEVDLSRDPSTRQPSLWYPALRTHVSLDKFLARTIFNADGDMSSGPPQAETVQDMVNEAMAHYRAAPSSSTAQLPTHQQVQDMVREALAAVLPTSFEGLVANTGSAQAATNLQSDVAGGLVANTGSAQAAANQQSDVAAPPSRPFRSTLNSGTVGGKGKVKGKGKGAGAAAKGGKGKIKGTGKSKGSIKGAQLSGPDEHAEAVDTQVARVDPQNTCSSLLMVGGLALPSSLMLFS